MNARTLTLYRPWWDRLVDTLRERLAAWRDARQARREFEAARHMDEATLCDIGAPLWLIEEARHQREQARFERTLQHMQRDPVGQRYW